MKGTTVEVLVDEDLQDVDVSAAQLQSYVDKLIQVLLLDMA